MLTNRYEFRKVVLSVSRVLIVKVLIGAASVWASGALAGMYLARLPAMPAGAVNKHLWLAAAPAIAGPSIVSRLHIAPQIGTASDAIIAVHTEKLTEIAKENQSSIDDRRLLHDEISRESDREVKDFNEIKGRMDVNEAYMTATFKIGGWIFGILQAAQVLMSIVEFKQRKA